MAEALSRCATVLRSTEGIRSGSDEGERPGAGEFARLVLVTAKLVNVARVVARYGQSGVESSPGTSVGWMKARLKEICDEVQELVGDGKGRVPAMAECLRAVLEQVHSVEEELRQGRAHWDDDGIEDEPENEDELGEDEDDDKGMSFGDAAEGTEEEHVGGVCSSCGVADGAYDTFRSGGCNCE